MDDTKAPVKRSRGRPALPPDRKLSVMLAPVKCTPAQATAYRALGGAAWVRKMIDACAIKPKD